MPRTSKTIGQIKVELLVADEKTRSGNLYPAKVVQSIADAINTTPVTIEEISPVERKAKARPVCYSWPEHAMAISTGAAVEGNRLNVTFAVKGNKFGKLLMSTIDSAGGQDKLTFMPVGIGETDKNGVILDGYKLQYVTFSVDGTK